MDKFTKIFDVNTENSLIQRRNSRIAESVLEEVKGRIAAKKLEEGIVAQAGSVIKKLKDTAGIVGRKYNKFKTKSFDLGAAKFATGGVGKDIANTVKDNPWGAGLVGGGAAGAAGLTAWGLKKPKRVQEAAPFAFGKKKDDEGKDKAGKALGKAKEKVKDKRVKYFKDEKGDQLMRHGGPMIGKKRKERGKKFVEDLKNSGAKEIDKEEFKRSGHPPGSLMKKRNRGKFDKGPRELDVNLYKKGEKKELPAFLKKG